MSEKATNFQLKAMSRSTREKGKREMKILYLLHEAFEQPATYLDWARARGYETDQVHVYLKEPIPSEISGYDMLIVMGGPQTPDEDREHFPYYDPKEEIALIQRFVREKKAVLGACLGAQLIGQAFGAPYEHSPHREIGAIPMHLTEEGRKDPLLKAFADGMNIGSWHGDMPGLTGEARVLAFSEGCPRQIIRYSDRAYAFQCHPEFTPEAVEALIASERNLEEDSKKYPYVKNASQLREDSYGQMNAALCDFLDAYVASVTK